ncbi:MAG: electron transfer flavoprotein-ubiquinone oxidoreductase [Dysgonamonadaceae bacterium]|jgi:electron-transferring-flavoprotein dehydrogenase|nr:electron transfer flavoprotein-ubiquinone oxidoreductase [Dysgonamonadaceae bacterium]
MKESNAVYTDVLIIGGGTAGLSTAIRLADLTKNTTKSCRILLVDKGSAIGSHILSGAIVNPSAFFELLPDTKPEEIPFNAKVNDDATLLLGKKSAVKLPVHVPYMGNKGFYTASLGNLCRFLAEKAEEKGVEIYPGFSVNELLYDKNGKLNGAKTIDTGVDHHGKPMENFQEGTSIKAKLIVFAEGTRGTLAKQLIQKFDLQKGKNPQLYSLACKELWNVPEGNIKPGEVYHTMGYPLNMQQFGGGFIYGLNDNKVALGLVVGLDYADPTFNTHTAFQIWKKHPAVAKILKGGSLLEYGAKTLPEGGYYSLPKLYTDGALIVGDSAGFVAMPALKGVHLSMYSGMMAAETAAEAVAHGDFSENTLRRYEEKIKASPIYKEMYPVRNFRQAMSDGIILGGMQFGTQLISGGAGFGGRLSACPDSEETKTLKAVKGKTFKEKYDDAFEPDKVLTFDKVTDVYYSGVSHDEAQVPHLRINNPESFRRKNIEEYAAPCQYYCSAEVYELHTDKNGNKELRIHFENCLHCKTCDIKEPVDGITWALPYGGNGPEYKNM